MAWAGFLLTVVWIYTRMPMIPMSTLDSVQLFPLLGNHTILIGVWGRYKILCSCTSLNWIWIWYNFWSVVRKTLEIFAIRFKELEEALNPASHREGIRYRSFQLNQLIYELSGTCEEQVYCQCCIKYSILFNSIQKCLVFHEAGN